MERNMCAISELWDRVLGFVRPQVLQLQSWTFVVWFSQGCSRCDTRVYHFLYSLPLVLAACLVA